jgi:hypothetical protein
MKTPANPNVVDCQMHSQASSEAICSAWRKELPDKVGMWLAAWQVEGEWCMIQMQIHRPGERHKWSDETWWYLGPIEMPNAKTDRRGRPVTSELETDVARPRSVQ